MKLLGMKRLGRVLCVLAGTLTVAATSQAATLPAGFTEALVASGLNSPTAMEFAPDGRLFVCEQGGRLRVIKNGVLLSAPFLTLTVSSVGERGLLGVAFDPAFATNQYVYVYYTATTPTVHNRISRFTANGDVVVPGSELVLLDLENLSATNHNGGAIHFGPDGKLYAAVGENAVSGNSQSMNNLLGKVLRLNTDGSIPTDNPFYATASGRNRLIWALGLRNPFTFAVSPSSGSLFINDVGASGWEEVNEGVAGANYGWPANQGPTSAPGYRGPRYAYNQNDAGCAITGGTFYAPATAQFPADYSNDYFFADYCDGWIRKLDPAAGNTIMTFATGLASPVDLKVGDDGSLYYLARGSGGSAGVVFRIQDGASAPSITQHPASQTVAPGAPMTFSVRASGQGTLRYQWQRNGANISGATSQDYMIPSVASADSGARFRANVSNDFGSVLSNEATLTVSGNQAPTGSITQPAANSMYSGGSVISYAGIGDDPEDGMLPASAFTWRVDFHHDTHSHPHMAATSGAQSGSFTIPTIGETSANVWLRIYLTVRDSAGMTHTTTRDIFPRKVQVILATNPAGLQLRLDGQPISTPLSFESVVGIVRNLDAPAPQTSGVNTYQFATWSDGGAIAHDISTPATNTTYTASYTVTGGGGGSGLSATYFNNSDLSGSTVSRVDPTVDFTWAGSPISGISSDTFSVRWTGQVMPQFSETYRFYTVSNDGVRLWVNGQQLVNRWTNHSVIEDSGTIALAAGQRYDIVMEFYDNTGSATARLLWSSASTAKAVIPMSQLFPQTTTGPTAVRVNFQPSSAPVPAGYLSDGGAVYGNRGNGQTYGWNADNSAQARDRNASSSPNQAYDTFTHTQKAGNAVWEIAVPTGAYSVRIVAGDASYYDSVYRFAVEGILTVSGTPTSSNRWVEGTTTVTVSDGRLTITNGAGASNNKICFVEITPQ